MDISKSALKLRETIDKAMMCNKITHDEYELIMSIALEDGFLDSQEKALLEELQSMIENKSITVIKEKTCNTNCDC